MGEANQKTNPQVPPKAANALGYAIGCWQRSNTKSGSTPKPVVLLFSSMQTKAGNQQAGKPPPEPLNNPRAYHPTPHTQKEWFHTSLIPYPPYPPRLGIPPVEILAGYNYLLEGRESMPDNYITNIMGVPLPPHMPAF